jgi:hypothetical protein
MPQRLTLRRMTTSGTDDRNNSHRALERSISEVPARADIDAELEDIEGRDRYVETLSAVIPPTWGGLDLNLDAHDEAVFAGNTFELVGNATPVTDHAGRLLHYELEARRIVG